jgi:TetR/AcrR family transcriptional repressor of nem operon
MGLFWEKGYFNTSVDDIIVATEMSRATLYKFFGGKDQLFIEMLKRFRKNVTEQVTIPLQNKNNGINGIKNFFFQFIELYETKNLRSRGCFLISTAIEIHAHNEEVAIFVDNFLKYLTKLFRDLLLHSQSEGDITSDININTVVDFLIGNLFGTFSLCRSGIPKIIFENHINGVVGFLSTISKNTVIK